MADAQPNADQQQQEKEEEDAFVPLPSTPRRRRIFSEDEHQVVNSKSSSDDDDLLKPLSEEEEPSQSQTQSWLERDSSVKQLHDFWKKTKQNMLPTTTKGSSSSTKSKDNNNNNNNKNSAIRMSKATRHEHEAAAVLLQVLQRADEKGDLAPPPKKPLRKKGDSTVPSLNHSQVTQKQRGGRGVAKTSYHQSQNNRANQPLSSSTSPPTPPPPRPLKKSLVSSSLSDTTHYLNALHQGDDGHDHEEPDTPTDLVDASATERIVSMASVFQSAANLNNSVKQRPPPPPPSTAGSGNATPPPNLEVEGGAAIISVDDDDDNDDDDPSNDEDLENVPADDTTTHNSFHNAFSGFPSKVRKGLKKGAIATAQEWNSLHDFFQPKKATLWQEIRFYSWALMLPSLALSFLLFYGFDNAPTGRCKDAGDDACSSETASASWWILFIGCRQVLMWLLAKLTDLFVIDFIVLQHPRAVSLLGPGLSLVLVQSKGWPSKLFWWGFWCAIFLYGSNDFNKNWLFWQDFLGIFNNENPSGNVTTAGAFRDLIIVAFVVSTAVCLKRNIVGLHLGARLYTRYNERLKETLREVLLISELSMWARRKRDQKATYDSAKQDFHQSEIQEQDDEVEIVFSTHHEDGQGNVQSQRESSASNQEYDGSEEYDARRRSEYYSNYEGDFVDMTAFLDPWDEPKITQGEDVTGKQIIEFHQGVSVITRSYFFSSAFGPVESREECIHSSQQLFFRLLKLMNDGDEQSIKLENLTHWMFKGCYKPEQQQDADDLGALFDPDQDGRIYIIDFIGAIDEVYKKLRVLEHAIKNASHISKSYEKVINMVFYFIIGLIALAIMELNPIELLVGVAFILIAFGFCIGEGTSQLFDGVLLILVRQPYDIGDKVAISDVHDPPDQNGSTHWMIESIDLVKTTARLMGTSEVASFSNGSLAQSRLINMNRSQGAIVYINVKFTIEIPYATIMIFRAAVEKYVDDRPQEWAGMTGFRTNRVEVDNNFVEYTIVLKHQSAWQDLIAIKESKTEVKSFCVEAQKQLGCTYEGPPMGVEITMAGQKANETPENPGAIQREQSMMQLMEIASAISTSTGAISTSKKDD